MSYNNSKVSMFAGMQKAQPTKETYATILSILQAKTVTDLKVKKDKK